MHCDRPGFCDCRGVFLATSVFGAVLSKVGDSRADGKITKLDEVVGERAWLCMVFWVNMDEYAE